MSAPIIDRSAGRAEIAAELDRQAVEAGYADHREQENAAFEQWSKTATAKTAADATYTLEYWAERKRQGLVRVRYVGLFGGASVPGVIRRVTTRSVFVKLDGQAEAAPLHPADLRPR